MQSCWGSMLDTYVCACFCVCMPGSCVLVSRVHDVDVATDVLGPVYWVLCLVRESGVRTWQPMCWVRGSGFKVHSRSLLKKKWSNARAAWNFWISQARRVNKTEDSHSVTAILISTKPYPKDCWVAPGATGVAFCPCTETQAIKVIPT